MGKLVNIADLSPQQLRQIKEAGEQGQTLEARYPFTTGLGLHRIHPVE